MKVSGNDVQERTDVFRDYLCSFLFSKEYFHFYNHYYHLMWHTALKKAVGKNTANILEISSVSEDTIPQVMNEIFSKESQYVSFNLNNQLNEELCRKTDGLPISVLLMDEDTKLIYDYFGPGYFNAVVFQDSINSVMQAVLFHKEGIDITDSSRMKAPPDMAEITKRELQEGLLEQQIKKGFLNLISDCIDTLTQNGMMIFSHHIPQPDSTFGCPIEFYHDMLNIIRKCILDSNLQLEEMEFEGFDRQQWMFLRKKLVK